MRESDRFHAGLCSISFRALTVEEILRLSEDGGVEGIEWGSDVHVPAGDTGRARKVARLCADAGIACPSLGSYVRADAEDEQQDFDAVLETALALGVANIRVWAGNVGSGEVDEDGRQRVADSLRNHVGKAASHGLTVSLEYHRNTLTDAGQSALDLLNRVNYPSLFSYWQPNPEIDHADWSDEIRLIGERCSHVHVFHWLPPRERKPLAEGLYWPELFVELASAGGWNAPRYAFLEHVIDDDVSHFASDFAVLKKLCGI